MRVARRVYAGDGDAASGDSRDEQETGLGNDHGRFTGCASAWATRALSH